MDKLVFLLLGALLSVTPGVNAEKNLTLNEKIEAYETAAIEHDRKAKAYLIEECGVEPAIYDEVEINTNDGKLYHFRVNTHPIGECDSSYIIKEMPFGMVTVFAYEPSGRNRYNVYDGGYVQNIGESSAAACGEDMYDVSDGIKTIYIFDQDDLRSYMDYGNIWCIKDERLLLDYLDQDDFRSISVYQLMIIDEKRVWCLDPYHETDSETMDSINKKLSKADLPENTIYCTGREEFKKVCKSLIKEKGYDVDKIFSKEPILGYIESEMWDLRRR